MIAETVVLRTYYGVCMSPAPPRCALLCLPQRDVGRVGARRRVAVVGCCFVRALSSGANGS
eukprot:6206599-Pleurochrysis_carterae.AAC.3